MYYYSFQYTETWKFGINAVELNFNIEISYIGMV